MADKDIKLIHNSNYFIQEAFQRFLMETKSFFHMGCCQNKDPDDGRSLVLLHGAVVSKENWLPQLQDAVEAQLNAGVFPEVMGDVLLAMAGMNYGERLKQYPGPIVLLNGERDGPARQGAKQIRQHGPGFTESIIPEAGHSCFLDQPEASTAALEEIALCIFESENPGVPLSQEGRL